MSEQKNTDSINHAVASWRSTRTRTWTTLILCVRSVSWSKMIQHTLIFDPCHVEDVTQFPFSHQLLYYIDTNVFQLANNQSQSWLQTQPGVVAHLCASLSFYSICYAPSQSLGKKKKVFAHQAPLMRNNSQCKSKTRIHITLRVRGLIPWTWITCQIPWATKRLKNMNIAAWSVGWMVQPVVYLYNLLPQFWCCGGFHCFCPE